MNAEERFQPRIGWVEESDAEGEAARVYRAYRERAGREYVPDILKCFSARPDFLKQVILFSNTIHFTDGHLTRRIKEQIATLVSGLNRCPY
ncbi:MAG: hypothetical protein FJX77_11020 [Armatimonadetes bacterium]|nr:hypothetical protein [Armatimonadota bacterium]